MKELENLPNKEKKDEIFFPETCDTEYKCNIKVVKKKSGTANLILLGKKGDLCDSVN